MNFEAEQRLSADSLPLPFSAFAAEYSLQHLVATTEHGAFALAQHRASKKTVGIRSVWDCDNRQRLEDLLVEAAAMRLMNHPNVVRLEAMHVVSTKEILVVTEVANFRLHDILGKNHQPPEATIKAIIFQALDCSDFLTKSRLVHSDIRLETILINSGCELKLASFQLSRSLGSAFVPSETPFSDIIHTPPEALSGSMKTFTEKTDIWAIGILFLELLLWKNLSRYIRPAPGREFHLRILKSLSNKLNDPAAKSLLAGLLHQDASQRLTAREALRHPYFRSFYGDETLEDLPATDVGQVVAQIRATKEEEDLRRILMLEVSN